jgi:hypothetical protein
MCREGDFAGTAVSGRRIDAGETAIASKTHTKNMDGTTGAIHFERFEQKKI